MPSGGECLKIRLHSFKLTNHDNFSIPKASFGALVNYNVTIQDKIENIDVTLYTDAPR